VSPGPFQAWILHRLLREASKTPFGRARGLRPEIGLDGYRDAMPVDARHAFAPVFEGARDPVPAGPDDARVAAYAVPWIGVLAVAERPGETELIPVVDGEVFLEFVPAAEACRERPSRVPLVATVPGAVYALAVTTDGGVWSRMTGDLVRVTSVRPHRLRVVGRVSALLRPARDLHAEVAPA
jgi:hypothetical protein